MKIMKLTTSYQDKLIAFRVPEDILAHAVLLNYEKGEKLSVEGGSFDYLLFLMEGKIKVCITEANGKTLLLSFYYPGSILGEVEMLLEDGSATTDVTAISPVFCVGIPMQVCRHSLSTNSAFMNFTAFSLAVKLDKSAKQNAKNLLYTLENRLCAYIEATNENGHFSENLTEIAALLGTSYRHLLRTIMHLCEDNTLLKCSRTKYEIINRQALRDKAKDCLIIY